MNANEETFEHCLRRIEDSASPETFIHFIPRAVALAAEMPRTRYATEAALLGALALGHDGNVPEVAFRLLELHLEQHFPTGGAP